MIVKYTHQLLIITLGLLLLCIPVHAAEPVVLRTDVTIGDGDSTYDGYDIIVDGCVVTINGIHSFNSLTIISTGVITHSPTEGMELTIAGDMTVDAGASIKADGKGYTSGGGEGAGGNGGNAGGAGHGGRGGAGDVDGGKAYDSLVDPALPGSGGGYFRTWFPMSPDIVVLGGSGGGVTRLSVMGELSLRGTITANGTNGNALRMPLAFGKVSYWSGGGGSGGSIRLYAGKLSGDGAISADGGDGGYTNRAGGGAGGRIALYFDEYDFTGSITVNGGVGAENGENGTVYTIPEEAVLQLNKQMIGYIETPFGAQAWQFTGVAGQQIRLQNISMSVPDIVFDLTGPNDWIGFLGLSSQSQLFTLPESGNYILTARGTGSANKRFYSFRLQETTVIDLLSNTVFDGEFIGNSQAQLFRVVLPKGSPFVITLDNVADDNVNELYAKFGTPPTRGDYDYRFDKPASADQDILVPMAYAGTWYILVYGDTIRTPGEYTLMAETPGLVIESVTPGRHGNAADAVLTIHGAGFDVETDVALVAADSTAYPATSVSVDSITQLTAVFAAQSVPAGNYDLYLFKPDGTTAQLADAFEVLAGGETKLKTNLILPSSLGYHTTATLYVEYSNTGDVAMSAPLLELHATQNDRSGAILTLDASRLVKGFWTASMPEGFSNSVQFLASGQIPGTLQPGESGRVPVYYAGWQKPWDFGYPLIYFSLGIRRADDTSSVDWSAFKDGMRPDSLKPEQWEPVFSNFVTQVGSTWGDYVKMLDDNAFYLHQLGERVTDIGKLLSFEVMQASGLTVTRMLASAMDAQIQAPGLPLTFTRTFSTDIPQHFHFGRFGWGWSDNWEWGLSVAHDIPDQASQPGTVAISGPGGSRRVFQPDSRPGRPYIAQPGDNGTLTLLSNGVYTLEEADGTIRCFRADGKLDYMQDTHGNSVTCIYDGNLLTSLLHSAGPFLAIDYTGSGCVSAITDSLGRTTSFAYDVSGQHLVLVTDYRGLAYSYDYCVGEDLAREHALKEVVNPDGSSVTCVYDDTGRLQLKSGGCGGVCGTTYAYGHAGEVTSTDAIDHSTQYYFDHRGLLLRTQDALRNITTRTYDDLGQLIKVTDAAGRSKTYSYDTHGNMIAETDALGYTTHYAYNGPFNHLSSITDANDNVTLYDYEPDGDLRSITDANGYAESWTYDSQGNQLTWQNRRGQIIQYKNDELGRVKEKQYPDGSTATFTYDDRGNLIQYTDATGTTTQEFDDADRLTKITYPGGQWLAYTYDAANRRASMTDQLGHRTNYHYDSESRLESLTDEEDKEIVHYAYDGAGRMKLKTLGNGVYTRYSYDAAGQITELSNLKPNGSILSRFAYTYDSRGRRTTMTTTYGDGDLRMAGLWTYEYDDIGQLIGWTAPDGHRVEYTYDALGNRLNVQDNGVDTTYAVNSLNQYTQVGDTIYQYDSDGNLIRKTAPEDITAYAWSADNRLTAVYRPNVTWQYFYDARGNCTRVDKDDICRDLVIDPASTGHLIGEYAHDMGNLLASYEYGHGLLERADALGSSNFHTFDALGSTRELVTDTGTLARVYAYSPFGSLLVPLSVDDRFLFVGEYDVTTESDWMIQMGARFYDALIGRFLSVDPLDFRSGDKNLYRYVVNSPMNYVDPRGLQAPGNMICPALRMFCEAVANHFWPPFLPNPCEEWEKRCNKRPPGGGGGSGEGGGPEPPGGCTDGNCGRGGGGTTQPTGSRDPNRKLGPAGYGTSHFIIANGLLSYIVEFENDATATAPAQIVTITDQLDENLDWATFELTEIGFGDTFISVPADSQHFETAVPMSFSGVDFEVQIEAGIRLSTGQVYANFYSIDPKTSLPPTVDIGFLSPEDGTGRGQGHVSYTIRAKEDLPTGTEIRNVAHITFEGAETVATNQVDTHDPSKGTDPNMECLNTLDSSMPQSEVLSLSPEQSSCEFVIQWTGTDVGAGIKDYTIYVSEDDGPFTPWIRDTNDTSGLFFGEAGKTYAFYSVARDQTGNREDVPIIPDATTRVESTGLTWQAQVSASEDDGYAFQDELQNLQYDFLKIGPSDFYPLPYYVSGMVFRDVNVPRGVQIVNAHLKICSHNEYLTANACGIIQAEYSDSATAFGSFSTISNRPKTSASVDWDHVEPWSPNTWYDSPDIASVIQEVIDRAGWSKGNSLALFYSTRTHEGGYRQFSSFDRGSDYAPILEIMYVP